ncbi:MAG: putative DNA binding domain-containing protein [Chitinispirillaceae bacterium]|nr:putative DNA binding domain-containing protein [Chitinispirillaceae bacterium]
MKDIEMINLIKEGENHYVEFKREDENNKDFAKTIVAFANSDGGRIFIGIDNDGTILGVTETEKNLRRIDDIAFNLCNPPITISQEVYEIKGKKIIVVTVPKGLQRPYETNGITYIRSSNRIRKASREESFRLFQASGTIYYDEIPLTKTNLIDIDFQEFQYFLKRYLDLHTNNEEELIYYLKNFHLINEEKIPTVTGILFFGREPQNYLPHGKVIAAAFNDVDISAEPFDKKDIIGTIPDMITQCESFFKIHLQIKHKIKNFEPEQTEELPLTALRELIINAIAHRDYIISSPIRILLFTDKLEIHSPGLLPNTVTIDSIKVGGSHVLRNPTIYNLLVKMKMVTDLGSGVRRAIKIIKERTQCEPEFRLTENEFIVTIKRVKL